MKKLIFLPVSLMVILSACKKSSSSPNGSGTITATIDGKVETFNTEAMAIAQNVSGAYALSVAGVNGSTTTSDQLSLTVDGQSPVTTGTYTSAFTAGGADLAAISLAKQGSNLYLSDVSGAAGVTTVKITVLTSTNVQGTFSGPLVLLTGSGAATVNVTNGSFNVAIK